MYQSAALFGRDHTELGEVAVVEITSGLAIGISRGRFLKGYPHQDPNEDAVFAGTEGDATVLAVADGHHGTQASHTAIEAISDVTEELLGTREIIHHLARAAVARVRGLTSKSDTALTISVVTPTSVHTCTLGDTSVIKADSQRATVERGGSMFVGAGGEPAMLELGRPLPITAVVTDGITSFVGRGRDDIYVPRRAERASDYVRRICAAAFQGGAGDNLAIAALTRPPCPSETLC